MSDKKIDGGLWETIKTIFVAVLIALVVRTFAYEPFNIPSGSMKSTLLVGDYLFVSKFAYGYSRYSFDLFGWDLVPPSLGDAGGRVLFDEPERGDVMVFKYPEDTGQNFIKRVVGLPGDRIAVRDNVLYVNGEAVPRELVGRERNSQVWRREYVETLGEQPHLIWQEGRVNPYSGDAMIPERTQGEWQVPEGSYFVMGDNRDNSNDSRFWGVVSEDLVVGEAFLIWMHWDPIFSWPSFSRNGAIDKVEAE